MSGVPVSKILVLDDSAEHAAVIKGFCDENSLVPLKVRDGAVMSVLKSNIDLGGILYSESYGGSAEKTAAIAARIHAVRPELPIIVRRNDAATLDDLPEESRRSYCAAYIANDMGGLRKVIDEYIFCLMYPNALLRGLAEITEASLASLCKPLKVSMDTPYIVRDRVIFGELFSLIQLESPWCRGYMMLQSEEGPFVDLLSKHAAPGTTIDFRQVNDLLSEITNLIWGGFKNRYIGDGKGMVVTHVQVPLIINHKHKYISFGSGNPQLCFRFTLTDPHSGRSTTLYARFVFNLNWSPEAFQEIPQDVAGLVDSGELELF
jgi:hypothetical protein